FTQIGVGLAQHAGAGVGLHALDRGLSSEAGQDRFLEPMHPAAVMGEHTIGFEHFAMLAALRYVSVLQHRIKVGPQSCDCVFQPYALLWHVVGNKVGDDDAWLMQHHVTERDAVVESGTLKP